MGKKKDPYAKGFEGYLDRYKANNKLAEQYGIDSSQYATRHGQVRPGVQPNKKSFEQYEADIAKAVGNDFDTRESVKYAKDTGNKRAEKIGTIDNIESAYKASTFMRKTHNKKMGNGGGDYKGNAEDQAGVANYWFNQSRENHGQDFATKSDLNDMSVEAQTKRAQAVKKPYQPSQSLSDAKERVQAWEKNQFDSSNSPFGQR